MLKNHYKTLGVHPKATKDQIKKAYRKIAKNNHPDKNPDNPLAVQKFREATEAYDVVSDEKSRLTYNKLLKAQVERQLQELYRKEGKGRHQSAKQGARTATGSRNRTTRPKEAPTGFEPTNKGVLGAIVSGLAIGGMALILLKRKLKKLKKDIS